MHPILLVDREQFFSKYKNLVRRCRGSLQYTWKDQICDTRRDCPGGSDEENCEKCKLKVLCEVKIW